MNYNHRKAQNDFDIAWAKAEAYYRENGMTDEQIAAMREFDLEAFKSDRRYFENTLPLIERDLEQQVYEQDFDHYDESNWLDALPEVVAAELRELPEEQLKAFYLYRVEEYTQREIAVMMSTWQQIISLWIVQIDEILQNHCKTGVLGGSYMRGKIKSVLGHLEN